VNLSARLENDRPADVLFGVSAAAGVFLVRGPLRLAILFALYAGMFFGLIGLLPGLLSDVGLGDALHTSRLAGWVVIAGAGGNLIAVGLLSRGLRGGRLICLVFPVLAVFGGCAVGIDANGWTRYAMFLTFGTVAGIVPATLFSLVPRLASKPELTGISTGMLLQGNNLGLVLGPVLTGASVQRWGRTALILYILIICALASALATRIPPSGSAR